MPNEINGDHPGEQTRSGATRSHHSTDAEQPLEQHHRAITRRAGLLDIEVRAVEFDHPSAVERFA